MSTEIQSLQSNQDYNLLVEEIQAVYTERIKNAREEAIRANFEVAELICTNSLYRKHGKGNFEFLTRLAEDIKGGSDMPISKTTLYNAINVYEKYGSVDNLLSTLGNNGSWAKAVKSIAPPKEQECRHCKIHCQKLSTA